MSEAAPNPHSSEIWAFQVSTGSRERNSSRHCVPSMSMSCSGSGSEMPPRAASLASRFSPSSRSSISDSPADPMSIICWAVA